MSPVAPAFLGQRQAIYFGKRNGYCMFVHMHSVSAIEQEYIADLASLYDTSEARHIFFMLLEARFGWSKKDYLLRKHAPLNPGDTAWLRTALQSLQMAKPIQHILGYAWFMGMRLSVNESVLIPRPETEELVNLIISHHGHRPPDGQSKQLIDIGTGSGCIAIALQRFLGSSTITYALDISAEALHVARQNATDFAPAVRFIQADILEWDSVFQPEQVFDIVVSNPPYITPSEQNSMHQNVLAHEPKLALFVEESTPLLYYDHIASFAHSHLRENGYLYFEINRRYGMQVCKLLENKGFAKVTIHKDMQGADRIVHAMKQHH